MRKTIRADFIDGNLVPLEPCVLNDGDEVLVNVVNGATSKPCVEAPAMVDKSAEMEVPSTKDDDATAEFHPLLAKIDAIKANMPKHLVPEDVPADAAKNYKHYLYGWPKETD